MNPTLKYNGGLLLGFILLGQSACTGVRPDVAIAATPCQSEPIQAREREHIGCVFEHHTDEIARIYNYHQRFSTSPIGRVTLGLNIAASGEVTHAMVLQDETRNRAFSRDLAELARGFHFGEGIEAVTVSYPLDFTY